MTQPSEGSSAIAIATYNIQSGRNSRPETALRAMEQMNVDLGLFTEAKLTDGIHTRYSSGYHVFATRARVHNQGGVGLSFTESHPTGMSSRCGVMDLTSSALS